MAYNDLLRRNEAIEMLVGSIINEVASAYYMLKKWK